MGQVNIYTEKSNLELERMQRHYALTPEQRFYDLIKLCRFSMKMAGRTTIGEPQGKGIVIRKPVVIKETHILEENRETNH